MTENLIWRPISPLLNKDGVFAVLSHLPDPEAYKPVPRRANPTLGAELLADFTQSSEVTAELGVAGMVSAKAAAQTRVVCRDVIVYDEATQTQGWAKGTRWGVGYRLTLFVSDITGEFQADTGWIAAAASVGLATVSFDMQILGFAAPEVLRAFPIPGRFDDAAWKELQDAEVGLRQWLTEHRGELVNQAVPLQVRCETIPGPKVNRNRALARLTAQRYLAGGYREARALAEVQKAGFTYERVVAEVYQDVRDEGGHTASQQLRAEASQWLDSVLKLSDADGGAR